MREIMHFDQPTNSPAGESRLRLEFLDGLRGLSALFVLIFHIHHFACLDRMAELPGWFHHATGWMEFGHYGVVVFIVLSGFCLMMPVARSSDGRLRGGLRQFAARRFRRIGPPYYAALACSLVLSVGLGAVLSGRFVPIFGAGNLATHLLLVHNVDRHWSMSIDPPMWSVATEWEIYFAFALLLLPLFRRFGAGASVIAAFAVGLAPHWFLPAGRNLDWACPWFVGVFALGMAGAVVAFSPHSAAANMRSRVKFGWIVLALSSALFVTAWAKGADPLGAIASAHSWAIDACVGVATSALLVQLTLQSREPASETRSWMLAILNSNIAVTLGAFSYSTYLIHQPLLGKILGKIALLKWPALPSVGLAFVAGLPALLLASYCFYRLFEAPLLARPAHLATARPILREPGLALAD